MFNLFAAVSYVVVNCITPGPNNIMSMANGTKYGVKKSLPFCAGVSTGFCLVLVGCILCNIFFDKYIPQIVQVLTYLGGGYIVFLAWVVWRDKPKVKKQSRWQLDEKSFFAAIVLQFVNPKALMFGITFITSFVFPYFHTPIPFAVILAFNWIVVFLSCGCWVLFGSVFQRFFEQYRKPINAVMALLLVYCAVSLFI